MTEELRNYEVIEDVEVEVYDEEPETSSKRGFGALALGAVLVGGAAALLYKNRNKLEERKIRKLEKKGYIVTRPDEAVNVEAEFEENEEA